MRYDRHVGTLVQATNIKERGHKLPMILPLSFNNDFFLVSIEELHRENDSTKRFVNSLSRPEL